MTINEYQYENLDRFGSNLVWFSFRWCVNVKNSCSIYLTLNTPQTKFPEDAGFVSFDVSVRAAVVNNMIKQIPFP